MCGAVESRSDNAIALTRDERQRVVVKWATETFGPNAMTPAERAMRVLEEAVELAQAEGVSHEGALAVADYVYKKQPGDPAQEVGGLSVCLLAHCAVRGLSADEEEAREVARVLALDQAYWRTRHQVKAASGVAVPVQEDVGFLLPGWTCRVCRGFNGSARELLTECRSCGTPRLTTDTDRDTDKVRGPG
jgi:hypothetical protein